MTQAILVLNKRNPKLRYFVRVEGWVNPRMYIIDGQIPFIGDTAVIIKSGFRVGGTIDKSGDENLFGGGEYK